MFRTLIYTLVAVCWRLKRSTGSYFTLFKMNDFTLVILLYLKWTISLSLNKFKCKMLSRKLSLIPRCCWLHVIIILHHHHQHLHHHQKVIVVALFHASQSLSFHFLFPISSVNHLSKYHLYFLTWLKKNRRNGGHLHCISGSCLNCYHSLSSQ